MASSSENISMAVFCDFENVALGVRDANYEKFDIKLVLERLLLKGSIVVKKAYCDWDRYKSFKGTMHEANFELIEIPHVRQSGKNSADIRMVVDALDLCYTKAHVDTFVIVSGDSDFSPLVSKLRENAKRVIGVGVKQSTSDLLVANCDEFIFYDDLVREVRRAAAKRDERKTQPQQPPQQQGRRPSDEGNRKREEMEARRVQALEMVVETFDALVSERGDTGKIWASLLKDTLKRRRPEFSETYYGFRTFGNLLEEAQTRGLFEFGRDEKSGTYVYRSASAQADLAAEQQPAEGPGAGAAAPVAPEATAPDAADEAQAEPQPEAPAGREPRRRGGRGRKGREAQGTPGVPADAQSGAAQPDSGLASWPAPTPDLAETPVPADEAGVISEAVDAVEPQAEAADVAAPADVPAEATAEATAETAVEVAAEVAAEPAPPVKERRRTPRAPRKPAVRKGAVADAAADVAAGAVADTPAPAGAPAPAPGTTATPDAVADDDSAIAADAETAVAGEAVSADAGSEAEGEDGADAAEPARKKSARPSHKAPSRKPSARAPRRPAKPKTPPENS